MADPFDLVILGSGFGGSLLAMVARRLGLRVLLLERGGHPRFAIGESTSPLANLLLEELARDYDLPRLLPFAAYGTWKRAYPEVPVGLKRGFTFYQHRPGEPPGPDPERERQLLVAASPYDEVADTHWYRAEFDHFLVREAQALGAEYEDRVIIESLERCAGVTALLGLRGGQPVRYLARFVVDATGPRGALSRLLALPEQPFTTLPPTQALFTHFVDTPRYAELVGVPETPPYPPDDAALHHVFPGGWVWVLRFENGITSAGCAVEEWLARDLRLADGEASWRRFLDRFPGIRLHLRDAKPALPFVYVPGLSYRCARVAGEGWALLPSAAAFVDPLFSTGFPLTLLGIHRLGRLMREGWGTSTFTAGLEEYAKQTRSEAETAALLVGGSYASFADFPSFAARSMLYFVAASYSELARRVGRPDLASSFLVQERPAFRIPFRRHLEEALAGTPADSGRITADLEPFNVAGLCDPGKRNWYGIDLQDAVNGAEKVGRSPEEVADFIARMGW